jgi:hypothetical protein
MPGNLQPLAFTTVPTYRQRLLYDVYNSTRRVLSFDPAKRELAPYHWYVTMTFDIPTLHCSHRPVREGERVPPGAWRKYREDHQFLGPGCLCPLFEAPSEEPMFVEAAIYLATFGCYPGQYVAECAKSRCGYLGQSLFSQKEMGAHVPPLPSTIRKDIFNT